ncbi:MAG: MEDS domain-containing protein [Actinomycetota bacterium]
MNIREKKAVNRPRLGEHICCLYDSDEEMLSIAIPFITAGLMLNEKCAVITNKNGVSLFKARLERGGIDTSGFRKTGQLVLRQDPFECPLTASAVNLPATGNQFRVLASELSRSGYNGYRCSFAVTDFLCHLDGHAFIEREILLNQLLAKIPAMLLLLYDRRLLTDSILTDMLEIHPRVIDNGMLYENPTYVLPEELL